MSVSIISHESIDQQPPLTHTCPMPRQRFWGKIAGRDPRVRIEYRPGEILVYHDGIRVARWLPYTQTLHYVPIEELDQDFQCPVVDRGVSVTSEGDVVVNPPLCPECELNPMELYRHDADRTFFWGCPGRWGPRRCEGRIDIPIRSLAELEALNAYIVEEHARQVKEGRRPSKGRLTQLGLFGGSRGNGGNGRVHRSTVDDGSTIDGSTDVSGTNVQEGHHEA